MLGAIIGDMAGSKYEFNNIKTKDFEILGNGCEYTDDSIMTLAVCEIMQSGNVCNKEYVIDTLKKWGKKFPYAGYGGSFFSWVLGNDREPYNSYGNGSAMRVSAVGWYANSEDEVKKFSKCVTEVTHNHPEGLKGAEVTAMCIYYARKGKSKEFIKEYAISMYPEISKLDYDELVRTYSHEEEICQVTVPQAIYCFLISKDFEDCLRTTISIGGDCDTTAAISCAIAEAYYQYIPSKIINKAYKLLPDNKSKEIVDSFKEYKKEVLSKDVEINDDTHFVAIIENGKYLDWIYSSHYPLLFDYLLSDLLKDIDSKTVLNNVELKKVIATYSGSIDYGVLEEAIGLMNEEYKNNGISIKYKLIDNYNEAIEYLSQINPKCREAALKDIFLNTYTIK